MRPSIDNNTSITAAFFSWQPNMKWSKAFLLLLGIVFIVHTYADMSLTAITDDISFCVFDSSNIKHWFACFVGFTSQHQCFCYNMALNLPVSKCHKQYYQVTCSLQVPEQLPHFGHRECDWSRARQTQLSVWNNIVLYSGLSIKADVWKPIPLIS